MSFYQFVGDYRWLCIGISLLFVLQTLSAARNLYCGNLFPKLQQIALTPVLLAYRSAWYMFFLALLQGGWIFNKIGNLLGVCGRLRRMQ